MDSFSDYIESLIDNGAELSEREVIMLKDCWNAALYSLQRNLENLQRDLSAEQEWNDKRYGDGKP